MQRVLIPVAVAIACAGCGNEVSTSPHAELRNSNGTLQTFPPPPRDVPGVMHVLPYSDFGPQSLAGTLLGAECYESFSECCCREPGDRFDIRVIVYAGVDEAVVRARYPSGPATGDFRFVAADDAVRWLRAQLADLERMPAADRIPTLEARLRSTNERLTALLYLRPRSQGTLAFMRSQP